ncbi:hypothetical protein D5R81_07420 [Parashewanella spongiae]|uniref:Uncharacterized protein n=1 Tax=Parashewanella spongiae TaxID=342950 RepID=A0A3A6U7H6_9GAMM|nr:hypothetical protein [Parashewanella spongiae]MCL1079199.1 hypothetical protein [Parashewanella spongiae]RJY17859.1 hypothetical protein D5R81_07420 [Parashewanella spongiae]
MSVEVRLERIPEVGTHCCSSEIKSINEGKMVDFIIISALQNRHFHAKSCPNEPLVVFHETGLFTIASKETISREITRLNRFIVSHPILSVEKAVKALTDDFIAMDEKREILSKLSENKQLDIMHTIAGGDSKQQAAALAIINDVAVNQPTLLSHWMQQEASKPISDDAPNIIQTVLKANQQTLHIFFDNLPESASGAFIKKVKGRSDADDIISEYIRVNLSTRKCKVLEQSPCALKLICFYEALPASKKLNLIIEQLREFTDKGSAAYLFSQLDGTEQQQLIPRLTNRECMYLLKENAIKPLVIGTQDFTIKLGDDLDLLLAKGTNILFLSYFSCPTDALYELITKIHPSLIGAHIYVGVTQADRPMLAKLLERFLNDETHNELVTQVFDQLSKNVMLSVLGSCTQSEQPKLHNLLTLKLQ